MPYLAMFISLLWSLWGGVLVLCKMIVYNEIYLFDNDTMHTDLYAVMMLCTFYFLIIVWFPLSDYVDSFARSCEDAMPLYHLFLELGALDPAPP